jgi:hypothetical protein
MAKRKGNSYDKLRRRSKNLKHLENQIRTSFDQNNRNQASDLREYRLG